MTKYRIVLFAEDGRELSSGFAFSGDDESACASAERLMRSRPEATAVQVFQDQRPVCRYERA